MTEPPRLTGPSRAPAMGGAPDSLVVFLHGWGADGNDLIALADEWASALPRTRFASPHAPEVCDENPAGRQWFSLGARAPEALLRGAENAARGIDRFLDDELARLGLDESRLALVGFSQGAMMALHVALRRPRAVAAVVGYSGALIGPETLADAIRARPFVFLAHGDADPVVPPGSLPAAVAALAALDVPVRWHLERGVGHGIDGNALARGGDVLAAALRR